MLSGLILSGFASSQPENSASGLEDSANLTVLIEPSPDAGFNYPYVLRLPTFGRSDSPVHLIVEVNNSGMATDDFEVHLRAARHASEHGVGAFAADQLDLPLLIPAFPRPASEHLYTHALDSDSLDIASGPMRRLDQQLLAMIDDAIKRTRAEGIATEEKFLITGFSASATFANRFSMIHPERIAGLAIGGFNGILMLPLERFEETELPYPLGLADYEARFGKAFDRESWLSIPQFAFMGENDKNDAMQFDDAYSDEDRRKVYGMVGQEMLPDRWHFVQKVYRSSGATFCARTYADIGHGTDGTINSAMADFLAQAVSHSRE